MNPVKATCTRCSHEFEAAADDTTACPSCGTQVSTRPAAVQMRWGLFIAGLLAPLQVTVLVVLLGATRGDAAPTVAMLGGCAGGIFCGALMGRWLGRTTGMRLLLGLLFSGVFAAVCVVMSCFGCMASGYNFMH